MLTKQLYLEDSYVKQASGTVLKVFPEKEGKSAIILDQTIFYPMGGGQPTDQGKIRWKNGQAGVYQVQTKAGEILHYVESKDLLEVGDEVHLELDWTRRYFNMRNHSAGHIVDFALFLLGYSPEKLKPLKGDHGKKAVITYEGVVFYDFKEELERLSNELVKRDVPFTTAFVSLDVLQKEAIYLQPNLPTNKSLRMLALEGVGAVADGGTQVAKTGEVGKITITSIFYKTNETDICYQIEKL